MRADFSELAFGGMEPEKGPLLPEEPGGRTRGRQDQRQDGSVGVVTLQLAFSQGIIDSSDGLLRSRGNSDFLCYGLRRVLVGLQEGEEGL